MNSTTDQVFCVHCGTEITQFSLVYFLTTEPTCSLCLLKRCGIKEDKPT